MTRLLQLECCVFDEVISVSYWILFLYLWLLMANISWSQTVALCFSLMYSHNESVTMFCVQIQLRNRKHTTTTCQTCCLIWTGSLFLPRVRCICRRTRTRMTSRRSRTRSKSSPSQSTSEVNPSPSNVATCTTWPEPTIQQLAWSSSSRMSNWYEWLRNRRKRQKTSGRLLWSQRVGLGEND